MKNTILTLLIAGVSFFGCKNEGNSFTNYYTAVNEGKIVSYQVRKYQYAIDSIVEKVTIFDLDGKEIQTQTNKFIKTKNGLDIVINGEKQMYLRIENNDCTTYNHPMRYSIKNCYLETLNDYKGQKNTIKYSYSEEITDGLNMVVYRKNDYSLIDKKEIVGSGSFDELIKVDEASIPKEIRD